MKHYKFFVLLFTMAGLFGGDILVNAMTDGEDPKEPLCTRTCSMLDDNPDCWKRSLDYFTYQLEKSVRDYAAILTHINYWLENLPDEEAKPKITKDMFMFEEASLNRTFQFFNTLKDGKKAPLDETDLRAVFDLLINKTNNHRAEYMDDNILKITVPCPIPCDYYPYLWSTLSYVLIACLVLCCLTFFLHTCYTSRRLDRHIKI